MLLSKLITPDAMIPSLKANTKKQALQELSERAALVSNLEAREILDAVIQRERLGSTGTGDGIAIPHAKLARAKSMFGIFARLVRPIDFEARRRRAGRSHLSPGRPGIGWRRSSQSAGAHGALLRDPVVDDEASSGARCQRALRGPDRGSRFARGLSPHRQTRRA